MKRILKYYALGLLAFLPFLNAQAETQPKFLITPLTPTVLTVPSNTVATVLYRVTNNTTIARSLTMAPIPAVAIQTGPERCSNPFVLQPGQSCILELLVTGSLVPAAGIHQGPIICKAKGANITDPYLCSQPSSTNLLSVNSGITQRPLAYIANFFNGIFSTCPISGSGIVSSVCASFTSGSPTLTNVAVNNTRTFLYSVGQFPAYPIVKCSLLSSGLISGCIPNTDPLLLTGNGPSDVELNNASTLAYISLIGSGNANPVIQCDVNPVTGNLENCSVALTDAFFSTALITNIALNNAESRGYLIANFSDIQTNVYTCAILPDGTWTGCAVTAPPFTFGGPRTLVLTNNDAAVYVGDETNRRLWRCLVNPATGTFTNCIDSGIGQITNFIPNGLAVNSAGNLLYVTDFGNNNVRRCVINPVTYLLSSCITTPAASAGPNGIDVTT